MNERIKNIGSKECILIFLVMSNLLNVILQNYYLSIIIIMIEISLLLFLFVRKDFTLYLYVLLSITFLSYELEYYISPLKIVDFKSFNLFSISLPNIFLIPIAIIACFNLKKILFKLFKLKYGKLIIILLLLQIISVIMGLINVIFNINGILTIDNFFTVLLQQVYYNYILIIMPILVCLYIITDKNYSVFIDLIKRILLGILVIAIFTTLLGIHGEYGGQGTIIAPNLIIFTPVLLLFSLYSNNKLDRYILLLFGSIGVIMNLLSPIMSKTFLIIGAVLIVYLMLIIKRTSNRKKCILIIFAITLMILFLIIIGYNTSELVKWKMNQFFELFNFFNPNWFDSLSMSPRVRIEEAISITLSFIENPLSLFFGKGLLGTFMDYSGFLRSIPENYVLSAFTMWEWSNGIFYTTHETFTKFYLFFGLSGMIFLFSFIFINCKNLLKTPISIVLFFSFIFFYGYSTSYCYLAMLSLILFIYTCNDEKIDENILIVDLWGSIPHKRLNNDCIKMLSSFTNCLVVNPNNILNTDYPNVASINLKQLNNSTNSLMNRIRYFYNEIKIYCKVAKKYNQYDKIFILCYEQISVILFVFLFSSKEIYIYQHQHIDWLDNKIIRFFFRIYGNSVNHIILEETFKNDLIKKGNVNNQNIHVVHHPCHNQSAICKKKNTKKYIAISSSNDESLVNEIISDEITNNFFKKNKIFLLIRSKKYTFDNGYLIVENRRYSDIELDDLYNEAIGTIILVVKNEFKNRVSGSIFDSLAKATPIFSIDIPVIIDLEKKYPNFIHSFISIEDLKKQILNFKLNNDYVNDLEQMRNTYDIEKITKEFKTAFKE